MGRKSDGKNVLISKRNQKKKPTITIIRKRIQLSISPEIKPTVSSKICESTGKLIKKDKTCSDTVFCFEKQSEFEKEFPSGVVYPVQQQEVEEFVKIVRRVVTLEHEHRLKHERTRERRVLPAKHAVFLFPGESFSPFIKIGLRKVLATLRSYRNELERWFAKKQDEYHKEVFSSLIGMAKEDRIKYSRNYFSSLIPPAGKYRPSCVSLAIDIDLSLEPLKEVVREILRYTLGKPAQFSVEDSDKYADSPYYGLPFAVPPIPVYGFVGTSQLGYITISLKKEKKEESKKTQCIKEMKEENRQIAKQYHLSSQPKLHDISKISVYKPPKVLYDQASAIAIVLGNEHPMLNKKIQSLHFKNIQLRRGLDREI
ncbi:hypothetical protein ADUPG1_006640 [Aduncisulcus paluster]|uniref:Uncharacterized protein n=1 Tax=Aduncisulcus paluster TaxID=2918883 RepID=A0ABQ5KIZ9_9EUKA|nr:hypothetical protein ADUPG1_006640 [Aduncisulcus paluster]|eukprot:gnl/Carplike_NY0171/1105_a1506_1423.p1 GENE.gnl/Carplike_NY0171/1105_a1506_1423~~gnl/Carplike_NY0171/1105_a1506_1423.p1  ORF type:complete len:370 (+),score=64.13 gnl/Carplike_NY0171/1105_a1506_1423:40-1149(+)